MASRGSDRQIGGVDLVARGLWSAEVAGQDRLDQALSFGLPPAASVQGRLLTSTARNRGSWHEYGHNRDGVVLGGMRQAGVRWLAFFLRFTILFVEPRT